MDNLSPSPTPLESPVAPLESEVRHPVAIESWRWQTIGGLLGLLLSLGYQWRTNRGWPQLDQPLELMQVGQAWLATGWFVFGWLMAGIFLWVDDRWSQRLYESPPITRSVGFVVVLFLIGSFVVTTSGSGVGIGLVMGLLTSLWAEVWAWQHDPLAFRERFLHDIRPQAVARLERRWRGKWGMIVGILWLVLGLLVLI